MWLFTNFAEFPCESLEALTAESTRYSGSNTSAAMSTFDLVGVAYIFIHIWEEIKKKNSTWFVVQTMWILYQSFSKLFEFYY